MTDYDPGKILQYLMYCDVNNLCGCKMSQKLPVGGFMCVKKTYLNL